MSILNNFKIISYDNARAIDVDITDLELKVFLEDGRVLSVPIDFFPSLNSATLEQRKNWRLIGKGVGIHWEELDEDISIASLLGGSY